MRQKKVLLTAFEAFAGETINPTQKIVALLKPIKGIKLISVVLPVAFDRCLPELEQVLKKHKPDRVMALGQAGGRAMISLERVAINVNDARIPDNDGQQPVDSPVIASAPDAYFARLPLKRMLQALLDEGIPAHISNSAGTYVCNHLMFGLLHVIATSYPAMQGGFIHVPFLPEQAVRHGAPSMSLETMIRATELLIKTSLEELPDAAMLVTEATG